MKELSEYSIEEKLEKFDKFYAWAKDEHNDPSHQCGAQNDAERDLFEKVMGLLGDDWELHWQP